MDLRLLVIAGLLAVGLAVPTAAVVNSGGEDDIGAVTLEPSSGPNGEYATVTNGELEVNFDALNQQARTTADGVFTITATENDPVRVWLSFTNASGDVAPYVGSNTSARLDGRSNATVLQPGDSIAVGFRIDTGTTAPDPGDMKIHAEWGNISTPTPTPTPTPSPTPDPGEGTPAPGTETPTSTPVDGTPTPGGDDAEFEVTALSAPANVTVGESTTVTATVANRGNATGTYNAQLEVNGTVAASRPVTIPAGESRSVTFDRTFSEPGVYDLAVGVEQTTLRVTAPSEGEGRLTVVDVRVSEKTLSPSESTTVLVTVRNDGTARATFPVDLTVAEASVATQTVTLDPGEEQTLRFQQRFTEPGVYPVGVTGGGTADVTVREPSNLGDRVLPSSVQSAATAPVVFGLLLLIGLRRRRT